MGKGKKTATEVVEDYWGPKFLELYNKKFNTGYQLLPRRNKNQSPDVESIDSKTNKRLDFEVKRHESLEGDVAHDEKHPMGDTDFPGSMPARLSKDNIASGIEKILDKELRHTKYTQQVALVIPTSFRFWTARELASWENGRLGCIAAGMRDIYPAGVWFFCLGEGEEQTDILDLTSILC